MYDVDDESTEKKNKNMKVCYFSWWSNEDGITIKNLCNIGYEEYKIITSYEGELKPDVWNIWNVWFIFSPHISKI